MALWLTDGRQLGKLTSSVLKQELLWISITGNVDKSAYERISLLKET